MSNFFSTLSALGWRLIFLVCVWHFCLSYVVKRKATFAESNLVSNQIRMQSLMLAPDSGIALVGSSMMARIPSEAILEKSGVLDISQLGLDGGRTSLGLDLLKDLDRKPSFLVLEGNSMSSGETPNDALLRAQVSTPIFRIARSVPWVRAKNRPSALIYSKLKLWNDARKLGPLPHEELRLPPFGIANQSFSSDLDTGIREKVKDFVFKLESVGIPSEQILIVMLPNGSRQDFQAYQIVNEISKITGITVLDLKGYSSANDYHYTDGLHLNVGSGSRAASLIGEALALLQN